MTERGIHGPGGWWPMHERSVLPSVLGVPVWAAVGMAAALTALGVSIDLFRLGTLGAIFTVCYVVGCLLAAAWVRRDGLYWTLVQPPLLVAAAVPIVVLLAGSPRPGTGIVEQALVIGAPLVNAFPIMAWSTGLTLAAGLYRLLTQRLHPSKREPTVSPRREPAADEAPGATRTSRSPRPS